MTAVYSVWATPPAHVSERLKQLMRNLRAEFGGPEFEPHVTVVGAMRLTEKDGVRKLEAACQGLKPYTARINTVSRGTFFYQCVYLLLDPTPEVLETSAHTCGHFAYMRSTPYMPHLSLLYGDLTDEEKEKAVERTKSHDPEICNLSFEVSSLTLYETDTEDITLKSWKKVADCNLVKE
ncbi:cyclic phosphodiesterase-like [Magnolia sinica]|uniref:cyclic phosphodiesterase-like n=1 Tax=Magnolia sinica TaxID=86752 RepID=UPI00265A3ECE|nr:cyclic phosphodiesterase-like [Magnolia sinica]